MKLFITIERNKHYNEYELIYFADAAEFGSLF